MTQQGFPQVNSQIVDPKSGKLTQPWYQLFIALWNRTGGSSGTASSILDQITSVFGSLLYRSKTAWIGLSPPSTSPRVLTYQGGDTPLIWSTAGSVTSVGTGTGLTGGPITSSGMIAMAQMATKTLKGNNTGSTANPADLTVSQVNTMLGVTSVGTAAVGQVPGTATDDNATAGNVGEFISSTISDSSGVSLTNNTPANITSVTLTPGDWDLWGTIAFDGAATTTVSYLIGSISAANNVVNDTLDVGLYGVAFFASSAAAIFGTVSGSQSPRVHLAPSRIIVATNTTYYLNAQAGFGTSTAKAYGSIKARRCR